jgi:hypothetical protein
MSQKSTSDHEFSKFFNSVTGVSVVRTSDEPFVKIKFDPNDLKPDFIGINKVEGAEDSDSNWEVMKIVYQGETITEIIRKEGIAWSNRGTAF